MDGRTLEKLREILGHSSVKVTERYAHLMLDMYCQADYEVIKVDLPEPEIILFRPRKRRKELHICDTERAGTKKTEYAQVAQPVEQGTENPRVGSSTLSLGTATPVA